MFFVIALWAFCLPIAIFPPDSNWGLNFESWLSYGLLFSFVGLLVQSACLGGVYPALPPFHYA
mgnify:CR=1 FL=1